MGTIEAHTGPRTSRPDSRYVLICLAEGAGFEPAVHGVDAGFQDRWFQPLTHPSDNDFL